MKTLILLTLLFASQVLSNKDVINMVNAGLSEDVIIAKIKSAESSFDTSTPALAELKAANVPSSVVVAMVELSNKHASPLAKKRRSVGFADVKTIYIAEMGKSDESERFRSLLSDKLSEKGFTIADKEEDSDATLKGTLSTEEEKGTTKARVSVMLKSSLDTILWSDDFGVRMMLFAGVRGRDSVKLRAGDVADGLHKAWKKAQKGKP
jgi:hypothetical protein